MGVEIERKFLLKEGWPKENGILYMQGYLNRDKERTVRVRIAGDKGYLTIKGKNKGAKRLEFEYEIPVDDAKEMLELLCEQPLVSKYRYKVAYGGLMWEIDEFLAENEGLIVVEVELSSEDEKVVLPSWIGKEVTGDPKYYNANLIQNPYCNW